MAYTGLNKEQLLELAAERELDVSEDNNKNEIVAALEAYDDANEQPEDETTTENVVEDEDGDGENDENVSTQPEPDETVAETENKVLARFVGANPSYTIAGKTFSPTKPFAVVTEDVFEKLPHKLFRRASKAEVEQFYGK